MKPIRPLDVRHACDLASASYPHARSCKKPIDSCQTCQASIAWFASLPLVLLSQVLEDRPKERRH